MLISLGLALLAGLGLQKLPAHLDPAAAAGLELLHVVGQVFLLLLKMVVLPLVIASLVSGMAGLGRAGRAGRVGFKTMLYYLSTTTIAVTTGLVLVNVIGPGRGASLPLPTDAKIHAPAGFAELLVGIVPNNVFAAMAEFDMQIGRAHV